MSDVALMVRARRIAEGDTLVYRLTLAGTHEGVFLGVLPARRNFAWQLVEIPRTGSDERFTDRWSNWDRLGLLQQLGVVPAATEERA